MHAINEVTIEDISRLNERELGKLLNKLLHLEAGSFGLQNFKISVPENEKSNDGGIDGVIEWNGGPSKTSRLFKTITAFQNKATDLAPQKCYDEILLPEKEGEARKLKPEIEEVIDKDGGYILFTTQATTGLMNNKKISNFRKAIKDAGKQNYSTLDIRVFDANLIKDWVNEYVSAVDMVQGFIGITKPTGYRDWKTTELDIGAHLIPYQIDTQVSLHIQNIRENILSQKVIRIIGHSGIGKTRLVLEAFRPEDNQTKNLNAQFVYCDIGVEGRYERLQNYIVSHRNTQKGIIVVDNCNLTRHNELSSLVKSQGDLKLITMGFDDNQSVNDVKIKIDRQDQRSLVRMIVQQQIGETHLPQDIDYVTKLCEGYPWMAVRYCEIINKSGISRFDMFFEDEAIEKLVFGLKPVNQTELHVLRACSVFSAFGFLDDSFATVINTNYQDSLKAQTEFIRTRICDETVTPSRFKEICQKFKADDIIEQRGVYYIVKPTVLAIQLAAKWLTITAVDDIKTIIEDLQTVQLESKFLERLTDLDQLDKARDIVEELFGINSSFGSAEVLKTEWGSLLFRYVVEVNPEATTEALISAFKDWTKEDLLTLEGGRRNLIWALEKLCFHKETFYESTKFLFRLAVSENETWANNATGQVTQLFQRFLAGTVADYTERIDLLRWATSQADPEYIKLAISCMSRAFIPKGQHYRSGGAENQGSGIPLEDFKPQTYDEIYNYWNGIMTMLIPIINGNTQHSEYALKVLARSVRTLITENASEILLENLKLVKQRTGQAWMDIRAELQKSLKYDKILPGKLHNEINLLLNEFQPKNLKEEFIANVILPEWSYEPRSTVDGVLMDRQQKNAEEFAKHLIKQGIEWRDQIPSLLEGEQRQGFNFGKKIGELDLKAKEIVREAIEHLRLIEVNAQNPGIIMGLISGINDPLFYNEMLQQFLKDSQFGYYALNVTKLYSFSLNQLMQLFELIDKGSFPITIFNQFRFGKPLDYLSPTELELFVDKIASYESEGICSGFSILFMHCYQNEEKWKLHRAKHRELILSDNLLLVPGRNMEPFYWATAVVQLLRNNNDVELAHDIAGQLSDFCEDRNFNYGVENFLHEAFDILFEQYFDISWPVIGEKLTNSGYITKLHLKSLIGTKNGNNGREGLLFKYSTNYEKLYHWLEGNQMGRMAIANIMPFSKTIETESVGKGDEVRSEVIHPFTKGFIDRFGNDEKVLNEFAANLGSFGTVGGSEWYFKKLMDLVSQLNKHPFREVRTWAEKAHKHYEKSLKYENLENQSREFE